MGKQAIWMHGVKVVFLVLLLGACGASTSSEAVPQRRLSEVVEVAGATQVRGEPVEILNSRRVEVPVAVATPQDGVDSLASSSGFRVIFLGFLATAVVLFFVTGAQLNRRSISPSKHLRE